VLVLLLYFWCRAQYNAVASDFPISARQVLENLKNRAEEVIGGDGPWRSNVHYTLSLHSIRQACEKRPEKGLWLEHVIQKITKRSHLL
jgi:hypothetical protein